MSDTATRIAEIKNEIAHEYAEEQRCITEANNLYVELVKYTKVPVVGVFILMAKKKKINQQINNLKVEIAQHPIKNTSPLERGMRYKDWRY